MNDFLFLAATLVLFALLAVLTGLIDRRLDTRPVDHEHDQRPDHQPDGGR